MDIVFVACHSVGTYTLEYRVNGIVAHNLSLTVSVRNSSFSFLSQDFFLLIIYDRFSATICFFVLSFLCRTTHMLCQTPRRLRTVLSIPPTQPSSIFVGLVSLTHIPSPSHSLSHSLSVSLSHTHTLSLSFFLFLSNARIHFQCIL